MTRHLSLISLVAAEGISNIGSRMTFFAIPWLVLVTTGSPIKVGLVTGAEALTYVVSGVLAAPVQDRLGDRRTSIWSDVGSVGIMAAIALFGRMDFAVLMVLVAAAGVLRAQADRSKVTMLVPLMQQAGDDYARVAAIREGVLRTSTLLGSSLAGIAIVVFGPLGAIWIDAGTFAIGALLVAVSKARASEAKQEPYFAALREGFTWFRQQRLLRAVTGMLFFTNLFNHAAAVVFVPLWVLSNMDDPAALGVVATAYALGLIAGSFVIAWLAPILPRYPMLVAGYMIGGVPRFLVLALSDSLMIIVVVTLISGMAMSSLNPTVSAMIAMRTPKEKMARVAGIITAVAFGGLPLGGLIGGLLVQTLGLSDGVLVATVLYFLVTLTPIVGFRLWRELNDTATKMDLLPRPLTLLGPRVTLRYFDGDWSVKARYRLRRLTGWQPVEPKVAVNALAQLDVEPLHDALNQLGRREQARLDRRLTELRLEERRWMAP